MNASKQFVYKYPHPAVTVDLTIFTLREDALHILLIERGQAPFKANWALPGGFVRIDEDLLSAASRELQEETGVEHAYLEQVGAFGNVDRDPRERVISIAFFAILASDRIIIRPGTDAVKVKWWPLGALPPLAFDHGDIVAAARSRLVDQARQKPIALQFLAPEFTLTELQQVHEAILGQAIDKRNFRKWAESLSYIAATGSTRRGGQHRPAALYRGNSEVNLDEARLPPFARKERDTSGTAQQLAEYRRGYLDAARELGNALNDWRLAASKKLKHL